MIWVQITLLLALAASLPSPGYREESTFLEGVGLGHLIPTFRDEDSSGSPQTSGGGV